MTASMIMAPDINDQTRLKHTDMTQFHTVQRTVVTMLESGVVGTQQQQQIFICQKET